MKPVDSSFVGMWLLAGLVLNLLAAVESDIYLHNPRGSNNRLSETTAARNNDKRLFDSQNNDRGGYNVGDAGAEPAGNDATKQYQMKYFQSSWTSTTELMIEWTMQHGCGGGIDVKTPTGRKQRPELTCDVILQYMCQENRDITEKIEKLDQMRDGVSAATQGHTALPGLLGQIGPPEQLADVHRRKAGDVKLDRGLHETWDWYDKCVLLKRNRGLFKADIVLAGRTARYTRQNPAGTQYGYECPAERDYYPYWDPTPWKDIAILTSSKDLCKKVGTESFSMTNARHECVEFYPDSKVRKHWSNFNNKDDCDENGGNWMALYNYLEKLPEHTTKDECMRSRGRQDLKRLWAIPYDTVTAKEECLVALPSPVCQRAPWTRANHLGNGLDAEPTTFKWKLPFFPSERSQRCVLRIRYNITSSDYDPATNASFNGKPPIVKDPQVSIIDGVDQKLKLQINGQQFGRTFEDRSHLFFLIPRPKELQGQTIQNLNVRGKRGNIVQTYPAVEYDFVPQHVFLKAADLLHIQWTGSNTHLNQPDGAAGVGKDGTDRTNIVQIEDLGDNFPMPWNMTSLFKKAKVKWTYFNCTKMSPESLALNLASSGFYRCITPSDCPNQIDDEYIYEKNKGKLDPLLNNAPASYPGVVLGLPTGEYHIMSTRSNQFSNRSQKKTINVCPFSCEFMRSPGSGIRG